MLRELSAEASKFLSEGHLSDRLRVNNQKDRIRTYVMLMVGHLPSPEVVVNHFAECATQKTLDVSSLVYAIWSIWLQIGSQSQKLATIVSLLTGRNIVDRGLLLSGIPQSLAQLAGLIDQTAHEKKIARVYTKIHYQQSKYSLLRQNNEGYAKISLLLLNLKEDHILEVVWSRMVDLVGNFDLDPDRVLDLVVQARMQKKIDKYVELMKNFRKESITVALGNKFRGKNRQISEKTLYTGPIDSFASSSLSELFQQNGFIPNPNLISFAAQLINRNIINYADLLPYLDPGDAFIRHLNSKRIDLSLQKVNKSFTLSMEEIDDGQKYKIMVEENTKFQGQLIYSSRLALLAQMVQVNDWQKFKKIWVSQRKTFDLLLYQPLLNSILNLMEWTLEPLMRIVSYGKFFKNVRKIQIEQNWSQGQVRQLDRINELFFATLNDFLEILGPYVGFRSSLFIKLCRIFKKIIKQGSKFTIQVPQHIIDTSLRQIIKFYLLPGHCYQEGNPTLALQLFPLLECYDYRFRYQCYLHVYQNMSITPHLARVFESIKRRQNIIVNNLSKENKKLFIRKMAKITHNQTLGVFYWIVRRILMQDYQAVVPQIVAVLNNCTPLTLEMVMFVMLYSLNEHNEPSVDTKNRQFRPWFKNVINFISLFFRKYLEVDIQPVFDYIINKTGQSMSDIEQNEQMPGALLKLLHQLLNKMYGSVMIQQVNRNKFQIISAGPKLQFQMLYLASEAKAAKKSKVILQKFFWEQNVDHHCGLSLAFNLLVLMVQKRAEVLNKSFIIDMKIIGDTYDQYSLLVVQLVRILCYQAQDWGHYALLLPKNPLRVLLLQYKMPLEIVFQIIRPGIKHVSTMNAVQWGQLVGEVRTIYSEHLKDNSHLIRRSQSQKIDVCLHAYKTRVQELLPASFFSIFWFLTLDSVYFPSKLYSEKIEDLKRNIQGISNKKSSERGEKQNQKLRGLLQKLQREQQIQRKKWCDTFSEQNMHRLEVDHLRLSGDKERKQKLMQFAQLFVQICLIPRMLLDSSEALFCVKFTIEVIRANKMNASKSLQFLSFLIEYVMRYLPFATQRQAQNCISIFLSQILAIFNNWNDPIRFKQDLKRILGVEETGKDNYSKHKQYLLKIFQRFGLLIKSIKQEPYLIKNCLYLLEKVDTIPGYKQQAEELQIHIKELKEMFGAAVDMRTILDRLISILQSKKAQLPERQEEKKIGKDGKVVAPIIPNTPLKVNTDLEKEKEKQKDKDKEKEKEKEKEKQRQKEKEKEKEKQKERQKQKEREILAAQRTQKQQFQPKPYQNNSAKSPLNPINQSDYRQGFSRPLPNNNHQIQQQKRLIDQPREQQGKRKQLSRFTDKIEQVRVESLPPLRQVKDLRNQQKKQQQLRVSAMPVNLQQAKINQEGKEASLNDQKLNSSNENKMKLALATMKMEMERNQKEETLRKEKEEAVKRQKEANKKEGPNKEDEKKEETNRKQVSKKEQTRDQAKKEQKIQLSTIQQAKKENNKSQIKGSQQKEIKDQTNKKALICQEQGIVEQQKPKNGQSKLVEEQQVRKASSVIKQVDMKKDKQGIMIKQDKHQRDSKNKDRQSQGRQKDKKYDRLKEDHSKRQQKDKRDDKREDKRQQRRSQKRIIDLDKRGSPEKRVIDVDNKRKSQGPRWQGGIKGKDMYHQKRKGEERDRRDQKRRSKQRHQSRERRHEGKYRSRSRENYRR